MEPTLEIKMVRENLALAVACWTAVKKGLITPAHLPTGRAVVTSEAGEVVELFNPLELKGDEDLVRCATNQVRGAFAFSVMQTHRSLESVHTTTPLQEADPDCKAARCAIYLLNNALRQDMLAPEWACPLGYRHRFEVRPISFVLDASDLDGRTVFWDDFGGLEKYLGLLEYCAGQVQQMPPGRGRTRKGEAGDETSLRLGLTEALSNSDPVAQFIAARCKVGPEALTTAGGLYFEYLDWCQEIGQEALGQRSFGIRLTRLGFIRRRRGRGRHWWQGVELSAAGG
jgi:hypothetical protein